MKQPLVQVPDEHTTPVPQAVPSAMVVQAVVDVAGWHIWQGVIGFFAPEAYCVPAMKQPEPHIPDVQMRPAPQPVPSGRGVHAVVEVAGWQVWQGSLGSLAPAATTAPA